MNWLILDLMKQPLYFISDNHFMMNFDEKELSRRKLMYNLFDEIHKTGGSLIIGGDFFDFWFDYKHVIPKYYHDIICRLRKLSVDGIEIHFLAGNHDYWEFGFLSEQTGIIFHSGDFEFSIDGQKILLTHGDGLLSYDNGYRLMKKIIRHRWCIALFRMLHADWGCALAKYVSNTSNRHNHLDDSTHRIQNEIMNFAKQRWTENYDIILVGHYHQTGIQNEGDKKLIWLGDWLQHFTVTKYDKTGWSQTSWSDWSQ